MKLSPVFHLKLQHCSNRPHNSAISPSLLHGNVISASSTLFSRYYALWNFAKLLELSTTTRSLNACSPCSSFPSVLLTEPLLLIWKKVSHWNLGANYPSPLQCNGLQLPGTWRRQHIWQWHGEASEATGLWRKPSGTASNATDVWASWTEHPSSWVTLLGLAAGTSKLFVWTCKRWSRISLWRYRTS